MGTVRLEEGVCPRVGMALQGEFPEETRPPGGEGRRTEWERGWGEIGREGCPLPPMSPPPEWHSL